MPHRVKMQKNIHAAKTLTHQVVTYEMALHEIAETNNPLVLMLAHKHVAIAKEALKHVDEIRRSNNERT